MASWGMVIWIWDTIAWKFDNMSGIFVLTFFSFSPFDYVEQDISAVIFFFFFLLISEVILL